jgi:fimbrial chaperone protein
VVRTVLALTATLSCSVSEAGAFSVSPVRLVFEPRDRAVALTLTNDGDSEVALQADLFRWQQDGQGVDQLSLTDDLIVAPPSLKMAPRSRQVVRVALVGPRDPTQQVTYRLMVREIPEATATAASTVQLPIALVLSLPVFITPVGAQNALQCDALTPPEKPNLAPGDLVVRCINQGRAHAQVRRLEIRQSGQLRAALQGGAYLLAGVQRDFVLKAEPGSASSVPSQDRFELQVWLDDGKTQSFQW